MKKEGEYNESTIKFWYISESMYVWTRICQWLFYPFYADQTLISKNIILKTSLFISKLCKNKLHHVPLTRLHINRSCFINTLTNVSLSLSLFLTQSLQWSLRNISTSGFFKPHIVLSIIIVNYNKYMYFTA